MKAESADMLFTIVVGPGTTRQGVVDSSRDIKYKQVLGGKLIVQIMIGIETFFNELISPDSSTPTLCELEKTIIHRHSSYTLPLFSQHNTIVIV